MLLGPRLELKQTQQLVMTPQLQQAIRLLQMSSLDAADFVANEVERNPLLKMDEGGETAAEAPKPRDADAGVDRQIGASDPGGAEDGFDTGRENMSDNADRLGASGEPDGAWSRVGAGGSAAFANTGSFEDTLQSSVTLREHLQEQVGQMARRRDVGLLAALLIDEMDEAGYLRADLDDLAERLGAHAGLIDEAVALVQSCDPVGVGARDLAECLALQLKARDRFDPAMAALVARLDDLAAARVDVLRKACGVDAEDLSDMIAELRALDPRPGSAFSGGVAQTVIPDVFVHPTRFGGWSVEVNADALPKVLMDTRYAEILGASGESEAKTFVAERRQSADWLIRALDQRAQTILKVSTEIVRRQSQFFTEGVAALTPMTLRDIAAAIDMHESTVSRVTSNKYLSCERGLFELKFFFTQALAGADGADSVSAEAVRHQIKLLINKEDPIKPLSDDKIVTLLKQSGVDVARRTVAKYREGMDIPSSARRKRMRAAALTR